MSDRSQELFLSDIIESIDAIKSFVVGFDIDSFGADRRTDIVQNELDLLDNQIHQILASLSTK